MSEGVPDGSAAERRALGRYGEDEPASDEVVAVRLLHFPLPVYARATEYHQELIREFALLAADPKAAGEDVPARLLTLIDELGRRYGASSQRGNQPLEEAIARGEEFVDLSYELPVSAREACLHLGALLDEADEYCRKGEYMLTLATPPEALAFRRWYLREIVRQIEGTAPEPWPGADPD